MILTVDPGSEGTGWALWDPALWDTMTPPLEVGICSSRDKKVTWEWRTDYIAGKLDFIISTNSVTDMYVEYPSYFQSQGGQVSADSGSLVKLCIMTGRVIQIGAYRDADVQLVNVNDWKGQLTKEQVIHRIKRRLPDVAYKTHEWDAVGIGLWAKGYF